jgi:outer membrane protein
MKQGLVAIALALAIVPAYAAELKIGFVNTERILREAAPAKKAQAKLEKEFEKRADDMKKMEKQVRDMQASIEKDGLTMSEADRKAKERDLSTLTRDFQRAQREFREDLNMRRNEELGAIQERANKVILQIAEQEKFDLIVQDPVFASPRIDITDKILKSLTDK